MRIALFDKYLQGSNLINAYHFSRSFLKEGHEVMFITPGKEEEVDWLKERLPGLHILCLDDRLPQESHSTTSWPMIARGKWGIKITKSALNSAEKWSPDVFHDLYLEPFCYAYSFTKKYNFKILGSIFNLKYFISPYRDIKYYHSRKRKQRIENYFHRKAISFLLKRNFINHLFIHSLQPSFSLTILKDSSLYSKNLKKTSFLYDPAPNIFNNICPKTEARKKLNLPLNDNLILFFGVITRNKGIDLLINAISKLPRIENLKFIIAGNPRNLSYDAIMKLISDVPYPEVILPRLEWIPEHLAKYYFIAADAVVVPYKKEYFLQSSGIIPQAAAAKRPIIASNVGMIGDVVSKENLGICVKPDSCEKLKEGILRFLLDYDTAHGKIWQKNLEAYAKKANYENVAGEIIKRYKLSCSVH